MYYFFPWFAYKYLKYFNQVVTSTKTLTKWLNSIHQQFITIAIGSKFDVLCKLNGSKAAVSFEAKVRGVVKCDLTWGQKSPA